MNKDIHNLYSAYRTINEQAPVTFDDIDKSTSELSSKIDTSRKLIELTSKIYPLFNSQNFNGLKQLREEVKKLLGLSSNAELDNFINKGLSTTHEDLRVLHSRTLGN